LEQTFVGEGEPLEVGGALLLEAPLLGRRVRPHLSPGPFTSLPAGVRGGDEEREDDGEGQATRASRNATTAEARAGSVFPRVNVRGSAPPARGKRGASHRPRVAP